jgi:3',5'-cyclic-AMP phosphodiesterase
MPTLLAQISDPHIRSGELGPAADAALEAAVRSVRALRSPPDAVLVSGDLTDTGDPEDYARVRSLLAPLDVPVHVLPGNHDVTAAFTATFGPTSWVATVGDLRLVGLDSTRPGREDGELDLAWLEARLDEDPATPTIVAMHHPPVDTGMLALDGIGLPAAQRTGLAELLAKHPQVRRVVAGHVHRTAFDVVGGCPVVCCTSTHMQSRLEIGSTEFDLSPHEPPAFVLHALLDTGALISHAQPIIDR